MDEYSTLVNTLTQTAALNNAWSADQALNQMAFQRMMSNTAHQREVADLKAAGLNPILSAKLGGASTPSGAMGTIDTSLVSSLASIFDKMLDVADNSAKAVARVSGSGSGYSSIPSVLTDGSESGKSLADKIKDDFAIGSPGFSGKDMPKVVQKVINTDAAAAFVNGFLHLDNSANKNTTKSYQAGQTLGESVLELNKGKKELVDVVGNGIKSIVNKILPSSAKTTVTTSKVSPKPTSSVASAAKSAGSKIVSGIKNIFKK